MAPDKPEPNPAHRPSESNPFRQFQPRNYGEPGFPSPPNLGSEANETNDFLTRSSNALEERPKIQPGVRLVAFGIDFVICYVIAVLTALIPFLNRLLEIPTVLALVFLARDFFFAGHGFGKNLMGLRIVDAATGESPTLLQSALRNIILIAPFVAFQIIVTILKFLPLAWLDAAVLQLCQLICTIYIVIVLPLEGYRTLTRADGLRKGDELAHTVIVEAQMDFSHFLPPPKV